MKIGNYHGHRAALSIRCYAAHALMCILISSLEGDILAKKELIINSEIAIEQKVFGLLACIAQEQKAEISRLYKAN